MRGLDELYCRLNIFNHAGIGRFQVLNSFLDASFFLRELGIFPIVYLFWERVVDELFHKRILPALIFFEGGTKHIFLFGGFRFHGSVLFFGRVYYKIENLFIKLNSFQLFADKLDELFFAQVRLRTPMRPECFGASVVDMTLLLFRRDLESALAAHHESAVGVFPRFRPSDKLRRGEYVLHFVEEFL